MQLNRVQYTILSFLLFICWNFAFKRNAYRRISFGPSSHIETQYRSLLEYRSRSSYLAVAQFFDNDYYSNGQSSSTGINPSDVFLSVLELQLAIIVQSTNITHAAIYISSESDEQRDNDEEPVMQLVCNYPPTPRDDGDKLSSMLDVDDFDDHNDSYESSNTKNDGYDDHDHDRGSSSSSNNRSGRNTGSNASSNKGGDKNMYNANSKNNVVAESTIEQEENGSTFISTDRSRGGVTIYPIQYKGINLGILQTLINKDFSNDDLMQNIPIFDFYDSQRSSTFNSWNPYKVDTVPSGCPICESVSDAVGASIALEMTRMSGLIDLRSVNRLLRERDDNVFLRSSSAIITTKTLLKMLSKRLSREDEIGLEIIKTISDQSDSISDAILELLKNPKGGDQEQDEEDEDEDEDDETYDTEEEIEKEEEVEVVVVIEEENQNDVFQSCEDESDEEDVTVVDIENGDDEMYDDVICDATDIPYVVRTLEAVHLDSISDQRVERAPVSHFFHHENEDDVSTGSTVENVRQRTSGDDQQTTAGIDFEFLEMCCIKEEETFVVFDGSCDLIEKKKLEENIKPIPKILKNKNKNKNNDKGENETKTKTKNGKSVDNTKKVKETNQQKASRKVKKEKK